MALPPFDFLTSAPTDQLGTSLGTDFDYLNSFRSDQGTRNDFPVGPQLAVMPPPFTIGDNPDVISDMSLADYYNFQKYMSERGAADLINRQDSVPIGKPTNPVTNPGEDDIQGIEQLLFSGSDGGNNMIIPKGNNTIDSNEPTFRTTLADYLNNRETGAGIQTLIDAYKKYSPMANIMKLGKTGIETAQKYFADKKEQKIIEQIKQSYASQGKDYGQGAASQETQDSYANPDGSYAGASTEDYDGGEKDGGHIDGTNRRRYGKGGIVSL